MMRLHLISIILLALSFSFAGQAVQTNWDNAGWMRGMDPSRLASYGDTHLWVFQPGNNKTYLRQLTHPGWSPQVTLNGRYLEMEFCDDNQAILVGTRGMIMRTANGGRSFYSVSSGTNVDLVGLAVVGHYAWAVGHKNTILYSQNCGRSWVKLSCPFEATYNLSNVSFIDKDEGWITGTRYRRNKPIGGILYTTNGGRSWTRQTNNVQGGTRYRAFGLETTKAGWAYIVGENGLILMTTDKGKAWKRLPRIAEMALIEVDFPTSRHGWIVGSHGIIFSTTDAGFHWKREYPPWEVPCSECSITDLKMLSHKRGYAISPRKKVFLGYAAP
jgi:photosystem II stability/assembly factor-like uncharacterized protein